MVQLMSLLYNFILKVYTHPELVVLPGGTLFDEGAIVRGNVPVMGELKRKDTY